MPDCRVGGGVPRIVATITMAANEVLQPGAVSCLTLNVPGLRTDMAVLVNKASADAGIFLISYRVSAKDTLEVCLWNNNGSAHTTGADDYFVVGF
jgi:hypothetical protein